MKALLLAVTMSCFVAMSSEAQAGKVVKFVQEYIATPAIMAAVFGTVLVGSTWLLPRPEIKIDQQYIDYHEDMKKSAEVLVESFNAWQKEDRALQRRLEEAIESGNIIIVEEKP